MNIYSEIATKSQQGLTLEAAALTYANNGFRIFPCLPGDKRPACKWKDEATTDPARIRPWWVENPDYNIGLSLDPVDDLEDWCVVDIDGEEGEAAWAALEAKHGSAPDTLTIRTPRGGRHLYFVGSLPSTVQKLGSKIDTRGRAAMF